MTTKLTVPEQDLPWRRARSTSDTTALHLVICWALEEPDRVGEVAAITAPSLLGRGGAQPDDDRVRLLFRRVRPHGVEGSTEAPLGGGRISRVQLELVPEDGELHVENVGRCAMLVRGVETKKTSLKDGDVLVLKNALVLLVVERPLVLAPLRAWSAPAFSFGKPDACGIVGESPASWKLRDDLAFVASAPHHVLVTGESGTGKELAARAIHLLSPRHKARELVSRNAASFPEGLVDAELFGSAKGYPNAGSPERVGLIGEADESTLFLDEIGELPHALQSHLLRVLDNGGEYQRLGESRARKSNMRLVAATNRDATTLKHDFAARLAARVALPTLRGRREDIPLLVRHLLLKLGDSTPDVKTRFFEDGEPRVDPALAEALVRHSYTHHLRELERLLFLAVSQSRGTFVELTAEVRAELRIDDAAAAPEEIDEARVRAALSEHAGNVTRAARSLGLKNRYVLYRLMRRHGIELDAAAEDEAD